MPLLRGLSSHALQHQPPPSPPLPLLLKQLIEENIAKTQVEVIANCWKWAEEGYDTLTEAAKNATDLLTVREAMEARDEQVARPLPAGTVPNASIVGGCDVLYVPT